jgi:hypothetical protein
VIMRLSSFQSNGMVAGVHLAQHKTVIRATAIESSVGERECAPAFRVYHCGLFSADAPTQRGIRTDLPQWGQSSAITFHVNKIAIAAGTEGRGAQDMVASVLGRRIGPLRASHPDTGGNRSWTC